MTLARIRLLVALGAAFGSLGYVLCVALWPAAAEAIGIGYIVFILSATFIVRALR